MAPFGQQHAGLGAFGDGDQHRRLAERLPTADQVMKVAGQQVARGGEGERGDEPLDQGHRALPGASEKKAPSDQMPGGQSLGLFGPSASAISASS